ncbi:MAG TPA: C45 family autoproteolytic acyltransferase/hydrolase, partial [Terracidiphilus sp.]|nr:C45 family autoproteolytic acyltransferase/hydrolase [Terracidiphilus sp.]
MLRVPFLLLLVATAHAAAPATPVFTRTFEDAQQTWTVDRGSAVVDSVVLHEGHKSIRLEPGAATQDSCVRLAPVTLAIGKRYELSGWVRTEDLRVQDVDRSPIAVGAALAMASMPFDVHSASLGGTQDWTHVSLKFVAGRSQDQILLTVGAGGSFRGKAWFEGVHLDEIPSSSEEWPAREAVETFGPAYRYPAAGWIYLHIEGQPYERGYQHGHLMSREIPEYLARCAALLGSKDHWDDYRTTANALFLRGFDRELLEEMRGIADGASDAGAQWKDRRIDLLDIVVANTTVEMGELAYAVSATPTGLEGLSLDAPPYSDPRRNSPRDHCSAFAATGPATRDGKMVIGHVTWWPLTLAEQTNVMLDIKPASGHRMLLQSYPGGIESGTDWYQNDAGVVLTETTIDQTPFNPAGTPVAFRARMAIQYSNNIDDVVRLLSAQNNGLYTNEWIMGDAKTNEIAIFDLGTHHTKLWRSSKNEWFGDTPGFYWGDNNAKDLDVRLETYPDPRGDPDFIPYVPSRRDLAWQQLYRKYHGQIDEQFGFLAFRSAPLVALSTMDAKVVTADMASHMMVWAEFGRPNQREWLPDKRYDFAGDDGIYPSNYYLFDAQPDATLQASIDQNEKIRMAGSPAQDTPAISAAKTPHFDGGLWKGWVLPASNSDTWFVAGSAAYYRVLQSNNVDEAMNAQRAAWRSLQMSAPTPLDQYRREQARGVLFLDSLRQRIGDDAFLKLMREYFAAHATKTVTADSFLEQAGLTRVSAHLDSIDPPDGPAYLINDIRRRLPSAVIVYGTLRDAGANRYASEQLQHKFLNAYESEVPIYKDFEVSDDLLRHRDVVFIGRPEANSALALWSARLGLDYEGAAFKVNGETHASERQAL